MVLYLTIVKHLHKHIWLSLVLALSWACSSGSTRPSASTPQPDAVAAAVQRIPDEPRPLATSGTLTRTEHDLLGEKQIPANAYYGVQTARALENFQISGITIESLPGVRRGVGDREARRRARQHGGRRDEAASGSPRSRRPRRP